MHELNIKLNFLSKNKTQVYFWSNWNRKWQNQPFIYKESAIYIKNLNFPLPNLTLFPKFGNVAQARLVFSPTHLQLARITNLCSAFDQFAASPSVRFLFSFSLSEPEPFSLSSSTSMPLLHLSVSPCRLARWWRFFFIYFTPPNYGIELISRSKRRDAMPYNFIIMIFDMSSGFIP